jgi:hypothetical protein
MLCKRLKIKEAVSKVRQSLFSRIGDGIDFYLCDFRHRHFTSDTASLFSCFCVPSSEKH